MTVSSTVNRVSFTGNGSTTSFSFPYYTIIPQFDIDVYLVSTAGVVTTQAYISQWTWTGTAVGNGTYPNGGSVVMGTAPPAGYTLVIVRSPSETQLTHWVDGDPDPAAVKELAFDRITLMIQRLTDLISLSPVMPDSTAAGVFSGTLPAGVVPPNAAILTNAQGTGYVFGVSSNVVSGSPAAPIAVTATSGVPITAGALFQTIFIQGNSGSAPSPITISATQQIATGTIPGQIVTIIGTDSTNTVTVANGNGLVRNGGYTYNNGSTSQYIWNGTIWNQLGMDNEL